ncbi:hypothetical protein IHE49_06875 [Rhodanobacter sp. 7MK24]|nr:hypothetical protein [Rhodanobacter sp. 7MK24]MBD8880199.1 hypothetical protein [Rhodanobacter sp. 7MK24]
MLLHFGQGHAQALHGARVDRIRQRDEGAPIRTETARRRIQRELEG